MPADAARLCRAGPALVSGQFAALGGAAVAGTALDLTTSPPDGYWVLSHSAAVACVSGAWHPDLAAGAIRPARVFPQGLFALPAMARTGSGSRRLGVRRNDGHADRPKAARLHYSADAARNPQAVRRRISRVLRNHA